MVNGFKAVLLDAYGTLFDGAGAALMEVTKRVVERYRVPVDPQTFLDRWDEDFFRLLQGPFLTLWEASSLSLDRTLKAFGIEDSIEDHMDLFFERLSAAPLYPEVGEVLDALLSKGIKLCVVSNADEDHLRRALDRHGLKVPWVASETVRVYKPEPGIFYHALERIGCGAEEVLHVGDSQRDDIGGARNAGLKVAWVNREGIRRRLGVPQPDYEVADLWGVLEVITR